MEVLVFRSSISRLLKLFNIALATVAGAASVSAASYTLTDTNFNVGGSGADGTVYAVAVLPDGKIMIGGEFNNVNGTNQSKLARLNQNGTLDTSFSLTPNGTVLAILVQPNGEVVIGGEFTSISSTSRAYLARVATNGTLDSLEVSSLNARVRALDYDPNGYILVGGDFTSPKVGLCQVDASSGSLDDIFPEDGVEYPGVFAIAVNKDSESDYYGKIYIGGSFTTTGGAPANRLARLNNYTLSVDTGFTTYVDNGVVTSIALQSVSGTEKIIVGGNFVTSGSIYRSYLQRFNVNGSMDFWPSSSPNNTSRAILVHPDSRVFVGGYQTTGSIGFTCYLSGGSLDSNGQTQYGATIPFGNGVVHCLSLQGTNIIAGGYYTGFDNHQSDCYTRLIP